MTAPSNFPSDFSPLFQHPQSSEQLSSGLLSVPPPLMMSEPNSFAHLTLTQRWPAIARRAIAENDFPEEIVANLEALVQDLFLGKIRLLKDDSAPDHAAWTSDLQPYLDQQWTAVPWFFAEVYFYRRFLEATQYFQPGDWQGFDPFQTQKRASLAASLTKVRMIAAQVSLLQAQTTHKFRLTHRLKRVQINVSKSGSLLWFCCFIVRFGEIRLI